MNIDKHMYLNDISNKLISLYPGFRAVVTCIKLSLQNMMHYKTD